MDQPIPFVIFGDGPRLTSGLARIARDLAARLFIEQEALGIRLVQVGVDFPSGWHWQGGWDFYGYQPNEKDQGRGAMELALRALQEPGSNTPKPIVLAITDPSRCYDLTRPAASWELPDGAASDVYLEASIWGYLPIDSNGIHGSISGPAADAVRSMDRVLAYGQYGAQVLRPLRTDSVSYLPHGLEPGAFIPRSIEDDPGAFRLWAVSQAPETLRVGCVATNQPRKDLGLLFAAVAKMRQQQPTVLWLHTNKLTHAWDVGQLAYDFGFPRDAVFVSTEELTDAQLAARYSWSDVTFAPGLGEGFGYPIVESLACGTPVVHGQFAGGAELIPVADWLVAPVAWRLESCYVLQRPVFNPDHVANALLTAAQAKRQQGQIMVGYCTGSVQHLSWKHLWPRWRSWIHQGLETHRGE